MNFKPNSFTLIELVIVIAVLAILSAVVVITINPAEQMRSARDSSRMSDLQTINSAIGLYMADGGTSIGSTNTVYVSIPDSSATCANLGLPTLPTGWSYRCSTSANLQKTNGTGWIPINFSNISFTTPLSSLPVDPVNTTSTGNYYTYITGGSWELTSSMESAKYKLGGANDKTSKDGGSYTGLYELGTNLTLLPLDYGDTSLVGYWKFDEGTGTTAYDASGHGNNGTLNNGPSYTTGKVGSYALSFDGSDDDVYCGGSSSLNSTSYTISVWFKTTAISPDNQTAQRMVSLSRASGSTKISLMMRVDKPKLIANGGEIETSSNTVSNDGNWHNFTTTYNGSSFLLYLDGSQKNSVSGVLSSAFQGCTIGSLLGSPSQGYFDGYIDDVRIYNRVLSAAEISAIYNLAK